MLYFEGRDLGDEDDFPKLTEEDSRIFLRRSASELALDFYRAPVSERAKFENYVRTMSLEFQRDFKGHLGLLERT
jgi:hypothetical protein